MHTLIAYIDPASGGLILQALLGGAAGAAVFFRTRIRKVFRGEDVTETEPEIEPTVEAEA